MSNKRVYFFFLYTFLSFFAGCSISKTEKKEILNIEKNNNFLEDLEYSPDEVWDGLSELFAVRSIPIIFADDQRKILSSEWLYINSNTRYRYNIKLEKNGIKTSFILFRHCMKNSDGRWESFESDGNAEKNILEGLKNILEQNGTNRKLQNNSENQ